MSAPPRQGTDFRELVEWAKSQGFTCDTTGGDHLIFRRPNTRPIYASRTPSCSFARKKTRRDLQRAMAEADQRSNNETQRSQKI